MSEATEPKKNEATYIGFLAQPVWYRRYEKFLVNGVSEMRLVDTAAGTLVGRHPDGTANIVWWTTRGQSVPALKVPHQSIAKEGESYWTDPGRE